MRHILTVSKLSRSMHKLHQSTRVLHRLAISKLARIGLEELDIDQCLPIVGLLREDSQIDSGTSHITVAPSDDMLFENLPCEMKKNQKRVSVVPP